MSEAQPKIQAERLPMQGRPEMRREDLAFMPAVVETLESPPSPYAVIMIWCIAALCAITLLLMLIGRVDIVASGRGAVIPPGNIVYIQSEIQGRIDSLGFRDGDTVTRGSVIVALNSSASAAQLASVQIGIASTETRRQRQIALLAWLEHWEVVDPDALTIAAPAGNEAGIVEQVALLRQKGRHIRAQLKNEPIPQRRQVLIADERRQAAEDLDQSTEKLAGLRQEMIKAESQRAATAIVAPVDGTLVAVAPLAAGMVVSPAQGLFQIVPTDSTFQIEAKIPTQDLGHVRHGDRCVVKLDAFPYTTWGGISSTVSYLGANALEEKDGKAFFVVRCALDELPKPLRQAGIKLTSGMSGSVEITTGQRSVLAYLLSPVVESFGRSFHER